MKSNLDPRHLRRIRNMQAVFTYGSGTDIPSSKNGQAIIALIPNLDKKIQIHAPKWPLPAINRVDLAILRCAVWELEYSPNTPPKVIIDEYIEIAKEYGTESSPSFINGVLGSIIKQYESNTTSKSPAGNQS